MAKRISIAILSVAIVIIGIIAINKLHYLERSTRIFTSNSEQPFRRGFDNGRLNFEGRENRVRPERSDIQNLPDSVLQQQFRDFRGERGSNQNRHRGGDFRRGNEIQLRNVGWFLAVFAFITLVTIYIDKTSKYIRLKKKENSN